MWGGSASNYADDDDEQAESHERKRQELLQVSLAPACCSPGPPCSGRRHGSDVDGTCVALWGGHRSWAFKMTATTTISICAS